MKYISFSFLFAYPINITSIFPGIEFILIILYIYDNSHYSSEKLSLIIIFPQNNNNNKILFYHTQNRLHGFKDLFIFNSICLKSLKK